MEFKFIDTIIENIIIDLEVLEKDTNNYTMLLFQHKGTFSVRNNKFGNETDCSAKFSSFIELAKAENVSLALTPEYSCPWNSIIQVVQDQEKWPNNSKLWVLCCESITPDEIRQYKQNYTNDNVLFFIDEEALNHGGGTALDPLCYVFKAKVDQVEKLVVLVQFKTQHMGVWESDIENQKYIWGKEVYVFRNNPNSINLFTNICSEAAEFNVTLNFEAQLENRWTYNPYIILHPQMNPKPSYGYFKDFRNRLLNYEYKDVISLNWGGGTFFAGKAEPFIPLSKSSILFKSSEVDFDDLDRFRTNHKRGLYYLNRKPTNHIFYLNPFEEVFLIKNKKPVSSGVNQAFKRRSGPLAEKVYTWNNDSVEFDLLDSVDDRFIDFLSSYGCTNNVLNNQNLCFIEKERLVNLSCGKAFTKKDDKRWYRIDRLESFIQEEDEKVSRLTYIHDESGIEIREKYIECIDCLNEIIITNESLFPENLKAFRANCSEIMFYSIGGYYNYKYNLVTNDGQYRATVAYIGRKDEGTALKTLRKLQGLFEKEDQSRKLVVVWYKENATDIKPICEQLPPSVNDDSSVDPNSIARV